MKAREFELDKKYTRSSLSDTSYVEKNDEGYFYLVSSVFGASQIYLTNDQLELDDWKEFTKTKES